MTCHSVKVRELGLRKSFLAYDPRGDDHCATPTATTFSKQSLNVDGTGWSDMTRPFLPSADDDLDPLLLKMARQRLPNSSATS